MYTDTVFSKPVKATINVFTAGKFLILKILMIVLLNPRHCQDRQTFPKNTTLAEVKAPQEANTSGEANVLQTTTLPGLKAPPEVHMSQKEVSDNMNPPNIVGEPPVQDEDMNPDEQPVEGEERSLSGHSTFGKYNNNGLLFAPTCTTCFNKNKYLSTSKKKWAHQWNNECFNSTGEFVLFPSGMFHRGYYNDKSNKIIIQAQLFCAPTKSTDVL